MPLSILGTVGRDAVVVKSCFDLASKTAVIEIDVPLGCATTILALMRSRHLRAHGAPPFFLTFVYHQIQGR